jgi:hypothetical protein
VPARAAPNRDIFVPDVRGLFENHQTNDRIVKLSKGGAFITTWAKAQSSLSFGHLTDIPNAFSPCLLGWKADIGSKRFNVR